MMKRRKILLVLFLIFLFLSSPLVQADTIEDAEGVGLELSSDPSGALVYIDGIRRGITPLVFEELEPGTYMVTLNKEGYISRRIKVTVSDKRRTVIKIVLRRATGHILVLLQRAMDNSSQDQLPFNPEIYLGDEEYIGSNLIEAPVGYHEIRVRAFGYKDENRSVYVLKDMLVELRIPMEAAEFSMEALKSDRRRFNPENPGLLGSASFSYEVSAPGTGSCSVYDSQDRQVYWYDFPEFRTWSQSFVWDGRDLNGEPLPDGNYKVLVEGKAKFPHGYKTLDSIETQVELDSSLYIRPQSLTRGSSGFLLAPRTETLPATSFQISSLLLLGRPFKEDNYFGAPPFLVGFRFTPLDFWDFSTSFLMLPSAQDESPVYISASVARAISLDRRNGLWGASLGLRYTWAQEDRMAPFGLRPGFEFFLPLSYALGTELDLSIGPAFTWTGSEGIPRKPIPRTAVSGGIAFSFPTLELGLSLRGDFNPETYGGPAFGPVMVGAELHFFPPPSIFILTLSGDAWFDGSESGYSGGIGIGLIH